MDGTTPSPGLWDPISVANNQFLLGFVCLFLGLPSPTFAADVTPHLIAVLFISSIEKVAEGAA